MMKRAVIIVKGDVQSVGYRDAVKKIARKAGVAGYVENLKPYDVKIVCEGEKELVEKFIEQIKIEGFPIFVEDIDVSYEEPTGEFEYFEIRRGNWYEELGERMDAAAHIMYKTMEYAKDSSENSRASVEIGKKMLEKQDKTIGSIENLRADVGQRFDILDMKYGEISRNLVDVMDRFDRLLEKSDRDREEFGKHMDRLIRALIESRK